MTEEEKKQIAEATAKAIADTKAEMQEEDGYISFTGLELEALIISASEGNKQAQEFIDFLRQEETGADVIKTTADFLSLQDEVAGILGTEKKHAKADPKALKSVLKKIEAFKKEPVIEILATRPKQFLAPLDKVSSMAFEGKLNSPELLMLAMERKGSKKPVTTMVSIDFDEAQAQGLGISGTKELTAYDRAIHDAITSLYIDGGNEYITIGMIYQTLIGNTSEYKKVSGKAKQAISESINKLMFSRLTIDAKEEEDAFYKGLKLSQKSTVLPAVSYTVSINGQAQEAIKVLMPPPLYTYAEAKGQIGRVDLKLLATPLTNTEETINLKDYLLRRVLTIKGSSKLSPSIVYETIYQKLNVDAPTQGALRKKKAGVRKNVKAILDYWKQEGFIKGYVENKRAKEVYSVTIRY